MPLHNDPIPFITLPNWVRAAAQCGFNIAPIFQRLEIATDLMHLETATVDRALLQRLMEACVQASRHGHFPFVLGETFAFDYLPDLETFLNTAPTLREAGRVFDWVRELINPMIDVRIAESRRSARLLLLLPAADATHHPYFSESLFAAIVKFGRLLLSGEGDFLRLEFRHAAPAYAEVYERSFRVPVRFDAPHYALEFDRALLDRPRAAAYPALHEQARVRIEQRLARLPRRSGLVTAVEEALDQEPALLAQGIQAVAARLRLHPRTLQRRLLDEGERYADLLARVRYRLALRALEDTQADLEALSERLGFSDRRSFTRAFTRWSGVTPSAFRERGQRLSSKGKR